MQNYKKKSGKFLEKLLGNFFVGVMFNIAVVRIQQTTYNIPVTNKSTDLTINFKMTAEGISSKEINASNKVKNPIRECLANT